MDVEKAIEHLLDLHARAEVRMDRTDRQIVAIQKLIQTGMKLLVRTGERLDQVVVRLDQVGERLDQVGERLDQLAAAQLKTDQKLDKLIVVLMKRPPNGKA